MLAAVLNQIGDLKLELRDDVTTVGPGPAEVRVRVRATGVCHSDVSAMNGGLPTLAPGILGHEGAGEVVEVGAEVTDLHPGDRVILAFVPPCGECALCRGGQPHLCLEYTIRAFSEPRFLVAGTPAFGMAGVGTFAEELVVPRAGVVKFGDDVPYEIAALVSCGVQTGVGAVLNTAKVPAGATAVVLGAGGVGISVIQGLRIAGASVIVAVDPIAEKHDAAIAFGATHATTPDDLAELSGPLTGGAGFDYAFDVVGRGATIRSACDHTRRGGTTVIVGAGRADDMVEFSAQDLFVMERRILGSFYGSGDVRTDFGRLLDYWRAGELNLDGMITRRLRLSEINDALGALRDGAGHIRQVVSFD